MSINDFRKILISTMCNSGLLLNNKLGEGYVDWHSEDGQCGVNFKLPTGEEFSILIRKDK